MTSWESDMQPFRGHRMYTATFEAHLRSLGSKSKGAWSLRKEKLTLSWDLQVSAGLRVS